MNLLDVILIITIGGFAMFGFWFGLIHTFGSLVGTAIGAFFASRWYDGLAGWLAGVTGWETNTANVLSFIIVFLIINRVIGFLFWMLEGLIVSQFLLVRANKLVYW